jgi:hypothetical protein
VISDRKRIRCCVNGIVKDGDPIGRIADLPHIARHSFRIDEPPIRQKDHSSFQRFSESIDPSRLQIPSMTDERNLPAAEQLLGNQAPRRRSPTLDNPLEKRKSGHPGLLSALPGIKVVASAASIRPIRWR